MGVARPPWPRRLASSDESAFVGRARELALLGEAWSDTRRGRRRAVFIGGEPGAGKSRLAARLAAQCHEEGAAVTVGLCFDQFGIPYQPFVEILEHLLAEAGGVVDALPVPARTELARITSAVGADRLGGPAGPGVADGEDRRRLFDACAAALASVAERWPLVVVLEDLHWAAPPTLQLLGHLIRVSGSERLLIVANHRNTMPDRSADVATLVAELQRFDGVSRIDLDGLGEADVADFLAATGGFGHARPTRWVARLRDQSGGNPFFLRELWHHLERSGGPDALDADRFRAPASVGDAIDLRLRALPPDHVAVLELAAVVGEPCDATVVVAAAETDGETALAALDHGVETGLLEVVSPAESTYAFVHDLARQALIDRIPAARRASLHRRVAVAIERSHLPVQRRTARLAHHWTRARLLDADDRAVHWLIEAGRESQRSLAYEQAAAHFEQAARLLAAGDRRRGGLLLDAALNAVRSGSFADGRRLYELVADTDDDELHARAAIGYEDACWRPGLPGTRAVDLLTDAARRLPQPHELRVPVLAALGRALAFIGRSDQARPIGEHAIEVARARGDDRALAVALQASLWHDFSAETAPLQLSRAREGAQLAERLSDWELLGQASTYRGTNAYALGELADIAPAREQLERAQRRSGQPFYAYMAGCADYAAAYMRGDFAAAEELAEALLELGEVFGQDDTEGVYGLQSFMVRRACGRLAEARPLITGDEPCGQGYWGPGLLALYTHFGMHGAARRAVDTLLAHDLGAERVTSQWAAVAAFLAEGIFELADEVAARRLLPYLAPHSGMNLVAGHFVAVFGAADRYLAMLSSLLGRPDTEDLFQAALELDQATGSVVHEAETAFRYAQFLRARDRGSDRGRAADLAEQAHGVAVKIGMVGLARRCMPTAAGRRGDAAASSPHLDRLTEREIEVLACLARGMSNRDIAEALFIAENTAANHVRAILRKTATANRTQAAMYATKHSLLEGDVASSSPPGT